MLLSSISIFCPKIFLREMYVRIAKKKKRKAGMNIKNLARITASRQNEIAPMKKRM
jgi:hypothetical protein